MLRESVDMASEGLVACAQNVKLRPEPRGPGVRVSRGAQMERDVVAELTLLALLRTRGFDAAVDYFAHNGFPRPAQEILARWRMAGAA
jgi:hypothetical protein